jgi:hypothetical protein
MSFSDTFNACMERNHMPAPQELFSGKTLLEALEILDQIHDALENAGGVEVTLGALAGLGPSLGLAGSGVLGVLGAAAADLTAGLYLSNAINCAAFAAVRSALTADLESAPDGFAKEQVTLALNDIPQDSAPA